jgi:hypothetical protein
VGLEEAIEPWILKLWDSLNKSTAPTQGTPVGGTEIQFLYGSQVRAVQVDPMKPPVESA